MKLDLQILKRRQEIPAYLHQLKFGVWLYIFLLIFEGGLRKWILPGLATPLLIIRDPIALWVMIKAYQHHLFPNNIYIKIIFYLTVISFLATMGLGHGNFGVALFGARILLIHFPFMFLIGRIFDREDVLEVGKVFLVLSVPMTLLIAIQFYSPQSSFVNRGVGGDLAGAGFPGSGEYMRPPGTFSFTTGNVQFYQMVIIYVFYYFLDNKSINKFLLYASSICLVLAIPLSISRTLFFTLGLVFFFTLISVARKRKYILKFLNITFVSIVLIVLLSKTPIFKTSTGAFTQRFESANEQEGGAKGVFLVRILGGMLGGLENAVNDPSIFGQGLGMGTNAGAKLLTGSTSYLITEGEWGRLVGEMGAFFGLIVIFLRVHITFIMAGKSYYNMRNGDILAWLLLSVAWSTIAQGLWAQPTALGFSTLMGGLLIASFNSSKKSINKF